MPVRRRFLPILAGLFLAISIGLTFLWIRSYWRFDLIVLGKGVLGGDRDLMITSIKGLLVVDFSHRYTSPTDSTPARTWGYNCGDVSSQGALEFFYEAIINNWYLKIKTERFLYLFPWGYINNQRSGGEDNIYFMVTSPYWLLILFTLVLPAVWFWRRRKNMVSQNSKGVMAQVRRAKAEGSSG